MHPLVNTEVMYPTVCWIVLPDFGVLAPLATQGHETSYMNSADLRWIVHLLLPDIACSLGF